MNAIQTDENSFLNSPTVFEKVGPTISKCVSSTRACAWDEIVPLRDFDLSMQHTLGILSTELLFKLFKIQTLKLKTLLFTVTFQKFSSALCQ